MGKTIGKKKLLVRQCKKPTTNYSKWKKEYLVTIREAGKLMEEKKSMYPASS